MASARRLAAWYFHLAQALEAGVPLLEALASPGGPAPRERAGLIERLGRGANLAEELSRVSWLPPVDAHLLIAGAEAGRLPATCKKLAARHEIVARFAGRALLAVLYPLIVVHAGALVLPLRHLVLGSALEYVRQVAFALGAVWLALAVLFLLGRQPRLRRAGCRLLPWFAGFQRARDLSTLATVLDGYVAAGVSPVVAWATAGEATGSCELAALGRRMADEAGAGRPPGVALAREKAVPAEFANAYRGGERSGRLDESLDWLTRRYAEEAERKLGWASLVYPQIMLLGVAVWVGVSVLSIYSSYLRELLSIME
jgi:type II secretory pathway component PulF